MLDREPVRHDDYSRLAQIASKVSTPIQIGENFVHVKHLYDAVTNEATDRDTSRPMMRITVLPWKNTGSRWDGTTTTDSRSQRNRAGRTGGQSLREVIKTRSSFPTDEAVTRLFYLALNNHGAWIDRRDAAGSSGVADVRR